MLTEPDTTIDRVTPPFQRGTFSESRSTWDHASTSKDTSLLDLNAEDPQGIS
jgi:hypothetical protein